MRVHELAKELGWPARQLIAELRSRGEYVKSAMSTVEAPVVRAIRRDFAAISDAPDPDASLASEVCTDTPLNLMLVEVRTRHSLQHLRELDRNRYRTGRDRSLRADKWEGAALEVDPRRWDEKQ